MKLVVNTNRIIAALIKDSFSRKIIFHGNAEFIAIPLLDEEVKNHKQLITKKADITGVEFDILMQKLHSKMTCINDAVVSAYMKEASALMDAIDPDDTPFIAAALATGASIWSDDKHFQQQKNIRIYTTHELNHFLNFVSHSS